MHILIPITPPQVACGDRIKANCGEFVLAFLKSWPPWSQVYVRASHLAQWAKANSSSQQLAAVHCTPYAFVCNRWPCTLTKDIRHYIAFCKCVSRRTIILQGKIKSKWKINSDEAQCAARWLQSVPLDCRISFCLRLFACSTFNCRPIGAPCGPSIIKDASRAFLTSFWHE